MDDIITDKSAMAPQSPSKLLVAELASRFPGAFVVGNQRRPLKLGIHQDTAAAAPDIPPSCSQATRTARAIWPTQRRAPLASVSTAHRPAP
jgi:sRNA-binding protein